MCRDVVVVVEEWLELGGWMVRVSDPGWVGYVGVGIEPGVVWWVRAPTLRGFSRGFCLVGVS